VFIPARRYVRPAKSAAAIYGNVIGISPNSRLLVRVDVADKATVIHVRTFGADTDNVDCIRDVAAGAPTQGREEVALGMTERINTTAVLKLPPVL
jgi:hypothetical protein